MILQNFRDILGKLLLQQLDRSLHSMTDDQMARSCFLLIFMMLGINLKDIYNNVLSTTPELDRMEYNRSKSQGRRVEKAFIRVKKSEKLRPCNERI